MWSSESDFHGKICTPKPQRLIQFHKKANAPVSKVSFLILSDEERGNHPQTHETISISLWHMAASFVLPQFFDGLKGLPQEPVPKHICFVALKMYVTEQASNRNNCDNNKDKINMITLIMLIMQKTAGFRTHFHSSLVFWNVSAKA